MSKKSKHPRYDDPTAFGKRFPRIETRQGGGTALARFVNEQHYKMGAIHATLTVPNADEDVPAYFMSVHGRDRYPDWDEIVWLRYSLIPDAARMTLILPNLNNYINQDDTAYKFVFTMEQSGWALDPTPVCETCQQTMGIKEMHGALAKCFCSKCDATMDIDMATWNEQHGNGFLAVSS